MAIAGGCGFEVRSEAESSGDTPGPSGLAGLVPAAACFSESANRVVLSVDGARVDEIVRRAAAAGVPAAVLGTAGGDRLVWAGAFDVGLADAETAWRDALPSALAGGVAPVG
jgi:phosphoribosylformylglycinamidine (FGAM) synthase-like enzyme